MATETEHASGGSFPPFDQIDTFPSQIFWLAVTFALLYFALANVFLPRIRKAIEARDGAIAAQVAEAAEKSAAADAAVKAFEAKVAEARTRARDTAAKARAEADAKFAAETARIEGDLAQRLAEAETRINEVRAKAMANVADVAEATATAIAEKLGGAAPQPATVKKAVAATMGG